MLKRLLLMGIVIVPLLFGVFDTSWVSAQEGASTPWFTTPYLDGEPISKYFTRDTWGREAVPGEVILDGQLHHVPPNGLPGLDLKKPVPQGAVLYNVCPEGANAWASRDPFNEGSGSDTFVALECLGSFIGWQIIYFHVSETRVPQNGQSLPTQVAFGESVAVEGNHTHLTVGYWGERKDIACPQYEVSGRWFLNPTTCNLVSYSAVLPYKEEVAKAPSTLDWWELALVSEDARRLFVPLSAVFFIVILALVVVQGLRFASYTKGVGNKVLELSGTVLVLVVLVLGVPANLVLGRAALWRVETEPGSVMLTLGASENFRAAASEIGYGSPELLQAFYEAAIPRNSDGIPVDITGGGVGKVFPPEVAAAIPFGETNTLDWGTIVDPTQPGYWGKYKAWDAVAERWPASWYEANVLGKTVSDQALKQRAGLTAIANYLNQQGVFGHLVQPQDLYGSSAGALGRTQILPSYFAEGALCGDAPKDLWNDPSAIAECTTRHLVVAGCWGSWYQNGDYWSSLCGYNPGAWDRSESAWYWEVLGQRVSQLKGAQLAHGLLSNQDRPFQIVGGGNTKLVSTPIYFLTLLKRNLGQHSEGVHQPESEGSWLTPEKVSATSTHVLYRVVRMWVLILYDQEELAALGVSP